MKAKTYIVVPIKLANGDMLIDIPKPLLKKLKWTEGTTVDMKVEDGQIHITKV